MPRKQLFSIIQPNFDAVGILLSRIWDNPGIKEVITALRSPWQNPFVERLNGSIRRDCLDHVIVLSESLLKRILSSYFTYYHHDRTHYGLGKDTPVERSIQPMPVKSGKVIELPRVGGAWEYVAVRNDVL